MNQRPTSPSTNDRMTAVYVPGIHRPRAWHHRVIYSFRNRAFLHGQDGYFEAALESVFQVRRYPIHVFERDPARALAGADLLVVNYKSCSDDARLEQLARHARVPRVLFLGMARAERMTANTTLEAYDLVFNSPWQKSSGFNRLQSRLAASGCIDDIQRYRLLRPPCEATPRSISGQRILLPRTVKRECLSDLAQYPIAERHHPKFHTTMLACPLRVQPRTWWSRMLASRILPRIPPPCKEKPYDVFFSGAYNPKNDVRSPAWARVREAGFRTLGGLQWRFRDREPPPAPLRCGVFKGRRYLEAMRSAKINLALDGFGQFTFRHLEIWCLGEFLLSSPTIRDLKLPLPAEEGIHYVAYDDLDDLVAKLRYYLEHPTEREAIARAGKALFDAGYDPAAHGCMIRQAVQQVRPRRISLASSTAPEPTHHAPS